MTHTFKNTPDGVINYAVVKGKKIYIGDWIHIFAHKGVMISQTQTHIVEVIKVDPSDPRQSCCYRNKDGKEFWPHRGDYCLRNKRGKRVLH